MPCKLTYTLIISIIGNCFRKVKDFPFDIELEVRGNIFLLDSNRGKNFRFGAGPGGDIKVSKVCNMLCLYVISSNGFVGIFIAVRTVYVFGKP